MYHYTFEGESLRPDMGPASINLFRKIATAFNNDRYLEDSADRFNAFGLTYGVKVFGIQYTVYPELGYRLQLRLYLLAHFDAMEVPDGLSRNDTLISMNLPMMP